MLYFSVTGPLCIFTEAFSLYLSLVLLRSWTPTTTVWVTRVKAPPDDEHQRCLQTNGRHSVAFLHFSRDLRTISTFDLIFPIDTRAILVFYIRRWLSDIFSQSTGMNANHSRAVSPKKKTSTWKRRFNGGRMIAEKNSWFIPRRTYFSAFILDKAFFRPLHRGMP